MNGVQTKKHVMVDLETLGTSPGCVVLSIGACTFDKDGVAAYFYSEIDSEDSARLGLFTDSKTLEWWGKQPNEAKALLERCRSGGSSSAVAVCAEFAKFLYKYCDEGFSIWGNGASFDEPILAEVFKTIGARVPWKYHASRCYRTLSAIGCANGVAEIKFTGTKHHALEDAKHQARNAVTIVNALGITL